MSYCIYILKIVIVNVNEIVCLFLILLVYKHVEEQRSDPFSKYIKERIITQILADVTSKCKCSISNLLIGFRNLWWSLVYRKLLLCLLSIFSLFLRVCIFY